MVSGRETQVDRPGDPGGRVRRLAITEGRVTTNPEWPDPANALTRWSTTCMSPSWQRGHPAQRAAGQRLEAVSIVGCRGLGALRRWRRRVQQPSAVCELVLPGAIGEEAIVANAVEAGREDVEEQLGRLQGHDPLAGRAGSAVAEAHGAVAEAAQALVADGDPGGVAAKVVKNLFGAGEGRLGVDHPLGLAGSPEVFGEAPRVGERLQPVREAEAAGFKRVLQRREEDPAEVAREHPDRQEESGAAGQRGGSIELQATLASCRASSRRSRSSCQASLPASAGMKRGRLFPNVRFWTRLIACATRPSALMQADERENQLPEPAPAGSASATAALTWRTQPAKSPAGSDSTSSWPGSAGSGSRS